MESFSILGIHDQVRDFLLKCIVEGGFFRKSKINRQLLQELKDVVLTLQLSSDVIETEEEKKSDNDEITILGIQ